MPGVQSIDAPRASIFLLDPDDVEFITDKKDALYDERIHLPVDEALVLSIMAKGVKKPIHVRKDGSRIQVLDGKQRTKAAREANKRLKAEGKEPVKLKAIVEKGTEADLFGTMVLTNRLNQADSPLEEAALIKRYLDMGRSHEDAAVTFGKKLSFIKSSQALFDCSSKVQKAVEAGTLAVTAAAKLATFPREEQDKKLEEVTAAVGLSRRSGKVPVRAIKEAVRKSTKAPAAPQIERKLFKEGRALPTTFEIAEVYKLVVLTGHASLPPVADFLKWICEGVESGKLNMWRSAMTASAASEASHG